MDELLISRKGIQIALDIEGNDRRVIVNTYSWVNGNVSLISLYQINSIDIYVIPDS